MDVILETADLWIFHQPGRSDELWLSFAGREDRRPSAPGFIAGVGASALHFVSKSDDWFQSIPLRALRVVEAYRKDGSRLVSFGQSMGAYAALATSRAIRPDLIIASAPQVVIDPQVCGDRDRRWEAIWARLNPGIGSDAREGYSGAPAHLFYDPWIRQDRWHASLMQALPGIHLHRLPGAGHATFHQLKELGVWHDYMHACLERTPDDADQFITASWRTFRRHYLVMCEIGMSLHLRGHDRRAERVFLAAIRADATHHKAWIFLYFTRRAMGDLPGALEAAQGAADQVRGRPELWTLYTDVMAAALALGDREQAISALETGLRDLPGFQPMRDWLRANNDTLGIGVDVTALPGFSIAPAPHA